MTAAILIAVVLSAPGAAVTNGGVSDAKAAGEQPRLALAADGRATRASDDALALQSQDESVLSPGVASSTVQPQDGGAPPGGGDRSGSKPRAQAIDPRSEPRPPPRTGTRHALAIGWEGINFFSNHENHYMFHSASLGYVGSFGRRGPFVHVSALLPFRARQDDRVYHTGDYYGRRTGGDLLVGWQWRWGVRGAEVEAGPGLHASMLWLPGKAGYRDFTALPLGVGLASTARWKLGAQVLSRPLILGGYASVAYDIHDPLHSDDLAHGLTSRVGMLLGLEATP